MLLVEMVGLALCASAQLPGISRYDLEEGLPQSMVNHVLQDRDGFIWLGTGDGLVRFDGSRMTVYKHDPQDSTSLSHNAIWGLAEADGHHLWVGTRTGLDRLDRRTGLFSRVHTGPGTDGCWMVVGASDGEATFYSPVSRDFLRMRHGQATREGSGSPASYCLRRPGKDTVALYVADSLIIRPLGHGATKVIAAPSATAVSSILPVGPKWLLLSESDGWLVRGDGTREEVPVELRALLRGARGHKHAARDPHGRIRVAINNVGLLLLREDLSIEKLYKLQSPGSGPLAVTTLAFDRQGNTWVGTDGQGVFKVAPQHIKFGRCMAGMGLAWEPPSWFVRGFAQWDAQRVVVAFHQGGLALFDERTAKLEPLPLPGFAPDASWSKLFNDPAGTIWAQQQHRVYAITRQGQRPVVHAMRPGPQVLLRDSAGQAVLHASGRYRRCMLSGDKLQATVLAPLFPDSIGRLAERLAMDPLGQCWASGVLLPLGVWRHGMPLPLASGPLRPEVVMTGFFPVEGNRAWMTTSSGLCLWSLPDRRILRQYTIHDGLPDQYLYMMAPAGDGTWWISSNKGLSHFDPGREQFRNYTTGHGLQSREFNSGAAFRSQGGLLYFGGVNGFNYFRPSEVADDPDTALVKVVGTYAGDTLVPHAAGIRLPFARNDLRIDLAVLEFTAPENNRYQYQLQGYESTWREQAADRPITFANLPHGRYTLLAKGINADGVIGPEQALLTIQVPLPFWASPWAITGGILLLSSAVGYAVYGLQRARARRKMAEAERELQELRLRTRLAKDIHDDVGSGLARMAALARSTKRGQDAPERFDKLAGISGELLENLRDVVWMNDPGHDTLDALLLRISDHARDLFEEGGAQVAVHYPHPLPAHPVDGTFRRNLYLIAKEALQNAHKYSGADRIELRWSENGSGYLFEMTDNGRGITGSVPQGGGHGSANMRQRAQDMGARYERLSAPGEGTTIRVQGRSFGP